MKKRTAQELDQLNRAMSRLVILDKPMSPELIAVILGVGWMVSAGLLIILTIN